jgi:hypothetical protein
MSSGAGDKKLSTCYIDILRKKLIGVPLQIQILKVSLT